MLKFIRRALPCQVKGQATLSGLKVRDGKKTPDDLRNRVFPWMSTSSLRVFDEDGEQIRYRGRELIVRLSDTREQRLAHRLRQRAIRQAWEDGSLDLAVRFDRELRERRQMQFVFSGLSVASLVMTLLTLGPGFSRAFSWPGGPIPTPVLVMTIVVAAGIGLFGVGLPLLLLWMAFHPLKATARAVRCTCDGIDVTFVDGSRVEHPWADLVDLRIGRGISGELHFIDASPIRVLNMVRLRPMFAFLADELLGSRDPCERQNKITVAIAIRGTLLAVVCGLIAAWAMTTYSPNALPQSGPGSTFWSIASFFAVTVSGLLWLAVLASRVDWDRVGKRTRNWWRRRKHRTHPPS